MKINLKNLKNLKHGMKNLTPEQELNVAKASGLGGFIGLGISFLITVYLICINWQWSFNDNLDQWKLFGFAIMMFCFLPMQYIQYRKAKNGLVQLENLKKIQNEMINNVG